MKIAVLAGGIGGARFITGLLHHLDRRFPDGDYQVSAIVNTADDITLFGLRVCPDLDTVMYTLGGGIHPEQGWGRADDSFCVKAELGEYGVEPTWFGLGDKDFATHIVRSQMLAAGYALSEVTKALCERWLAPIYGDRLHLLPMSDQGVETHIVIADAETGTERAIHFQEWWVRLHARVPATRIGFVGIERAQPAPGVLTALAEADVIVLPPSNPVVSLGPILSVPGIRTAIIEASAPVVGLSPLIGGAPVRGMADACLTAIGVESSTEAVAGLFRDLLSGWLVDSSDAGAAAALTAAGLPTRAVPLLMTDPSATARMAEAALELVGVSRAGTPR